ncbi:MAG: amidase [Chloroflexi bacterium]|nr:amidase [Chloroflexota bacterium]
MTDEPKITTTDLKHVERVIGLTFTPAERKLMLGTVNEQRANYAAARAIPIENAVPPAFVFDPRLPGMTFEAKKRRSKFSRVRTPNVPANLDDLAFLPVTQLAKLIQSRKVTSVQLTKMYLERLKRTDPILHCVVTLTEELALKQARKADREIAAGNYRGLLHGLPYGAKDLLATRGIQTTWGAEPYRDRAFDYNATVIDRLEEAGAVLIGKLTVGALAWGDVGLDGVMTRNPWNVEEGSSGSSAGSASAVAAGLVGFAIGTETLGSIVSPCTRCRVTGLRPTFGRVSRFGVMALSWTMDKIGPIARSVEDCAIVFDAIYGPDDKDFTVTDYAFNYDATLEVKSLRVGYVTSAFEVERDNRVNDETSLAVLRSLGVNLIPIDLPDLPVDKLEHILMAEAAAAFDDLMRSNTDDQLARQVADAWPNVFRASRLIPAVEYVQANRLRILAMRAMRDLMDTIDVYVAPSFHNSNLMLTNLTGHPAVVVPNGVDAKGNSSSITFTGRLYGEAAALSVAKAYQDATRFHQRQPTL